MPPASKGKPAKIEWTDVHRRLEAAHAALEQGAKPTPEQQRAILAARTKALAQASEEPTDDALSAEALEVVEFQLARERYGVQTSAVREVYPMKELTPLPGTPAYVLGIINVRGRVLSVLDLKRFFDLPQRGLSELNKVIVLRSEAMEFGLLADAILGVRRLAPGELQEALPTLTGIRAAYLKGVTRDRLIVLDAQALLSDKAIIVREDVEG